MDTSLLDVVEMRGAITTLCCGIMSAGIGNLFFVINELFCNSLITLLCIAKEALFKQTALNKYYAQKYLCNCFIVCLSLLSPVNSFDEASGLP